MENSVSLLVAFFSGLLSFFSPCVLPLIPLYLSFITGLSIEQLDRGNKNVLAEILLFCSGFSLVFISLGASAISFGNFLINNKNLIEIIGGIIIVLFGLHTLGLFRIKFLDYEKRLHLNSRPLNIFGSFIVGVTFAIGWTPCIGPILGTILTLAATKNTLSQGIFLLGSYSIGLAVPFILIGLSLDRFLKYFSRMKKYSRIISIIIGMLLLGIGFYLLGKGLRG